MSADREIDSWLDELGFGYPESRGPARRALEEAGLTRPGKRRLSEEKLARAAQELGARFFLHCESPNCQQAARRAGRPGLRASQKSACASCGGSDNRRAQTAFAQACVARGVRRVVVVGGSPSVRTELDEALGAALELRTVDGTERRTADRARSDLEWADLVLVWGASELHHKVSGLYTHAPAPLKSKVVHVAKRSIAALLAEGLRHLGG